MHRFQIPKDASIETFEQRDQIRIAQTDVVQHIKVTRIRDGEEVELIDFDRFLLYTARYAGAEKKSVHFEVLSKKKLEPDTPLIHLYQGTPKLGKLDYIVQKSVEVGVHAIYFVDTKRSEPLKKLDRLERIALEAALQSKSPILPTVHASGPLANVDFSEYDAVFFCFENPSTDSKEIEISKGSKFAVIIGPEGGFTGEEAEWAKTHFGTFYTLGHRIQRTETAPISAIAVIANAYRRKEKVSDVSLKGDAL